MLQRKSKIYLALMHYPVTNKTGEVVTTAITNMDLHDIARSSRTYGINRYYVVTPLDSQIMLAERILGYWSDSLGSRIIPDRKEALNLVKVNDTIEKVIEHITQENGHKPILIATDARNYGARISYQDVIEKLHSQERPILLLFGTGYGLTKEFLDTCDYILEPILGNDDYNHLSVRAAVAITLDRLLGNKENNSKQVENNEMKSMKQKEENYASSY